MTTAIIFIQIVTWVVTVTMVIHLIASSIIKSRKD